MKQEGGLVSLSDNKIVLGEENNGDKVFIKRGKWECDWYFSYGNIQIKSPYKREPHTLTHWDSYFTGSKHVEPDDIRDLITTELSAKKLWKLCDLFKSFYSLREVSGIYYRGNSHLSSVYSDLEDTFSKTRVDKDIAKVIIKSQHLLGFDNYEYIINNPVDFSDEQTQEIIFRGDKYE